MQRVFLAAFPAVCALLSQSVAQAQRGVGDWTTGGFDAQRSHWVRNDAKISVESMRKPGFALDWKLNLNDISGKQATLTPPVLLDFYIGYRGFRSLGFFGGSSNTVVGIDTDLGRLEWKKNVDPRSSASGNDSCPGGMTSGVTRATTLSYPPVPTGRGAGRGNPARSGVGEPFEGAVTLKTVRPPAPAPPPPPPAAGTAAASTRRAAPAPNPFAPRAQYVYALSSDGKFHSLYVSNGEEPNPPIPFLPANANAQGLIVFDNQAYVSTANGCGGVENGVWALDIQSKTVNHWKAPGKGIAGSAGPAVSPDGTVYAAAGNELTALEERTLKPKGTYKIGGQEFTSSPVIFEFKGKDLVAAASDDGRLHLIDSANMAKALATTPASPSSKGFEAGALASWQDTSGTRWVLAPTPGSITAWKVVEQNGAPTLQSGWVSRDMVSPLTPIVVNGVVFAASRGNEKQNATVYALDSATGKELWNSGQTITSFVKKGGLSAGGSRVYLAAQDGTQYVFSFPIEH
jgi:outer membrane protein assembly factor BamB